MIILLKQIYTSGQIDLSSVQNRRWTFTSQNYTIFLFLYLFIVSDSFFYVSKYHFATEQKEMINKKKNETSWKNTKKMGNYLLRRFPNEENDKYRLKLLVVCTAKLRTFSNTPNFLVEKCHLFAFFIHFLPTKSRFFSTYKKYSTTHCCFCLQIE